MRLELSCVAIIGSVILGLQGSPAFAEDTWSRSKNRAQGFEVAHPSHWKVAISKETNVAGKYGLSLLNFDMFKSRKMEMSIYTLDNPDQKTVDKFLTSGKLKSTNFIRRRVGSVNGLEAVLVGYKYTPPQWGIIQYEVEMMIALSPKKMVYVQIAATKAVEAEELKTFVEKVQRSLKKI